MLIEEIRLEGPVQQLRVVGDVALTSYVGSTTAAASALQSATDSMATVVNLEGPIAEDPVGIDGSSVWSSPTALRRVVDELGVVACSVANNHIHDLGGDLRPTVAWASDSSIGVFGLVGIGIAPALALQDSEGRQWVLAGCGWPGSGCRRRIKGRWRMLSPLDREFDALLVDLRHRWPDAMLIVLPHWNYEFEIHPQPMFRACARRWAALGVDCVAGAHPHVIGGYEAFGSTPVAYSLGNAIFDRTQYFDGSLRVRPEEGQLGALILDHDTRTAELHSASLEGHVTRLAGPAISDWTGYDYGLPRSYADWYRTNRRHRRRGLPVFGERDHPRVVTTKEALVRQRAWAISNAHRLLRQR